MRFRLTYEGDLRSSQRGRNLQKSLSLVTHKHSIRKVFHRQIKSFWQSNKFLSSHILTEQLSEKPSVIELVFSTSGKPYFSLQDATAEHFKIGNYRFVPIAIDMFNLQCNLDILLLQNSGSGALSSGDLDNRLKTLIDALRMPQREEELSGFNAPEEDERPFFCLLENDDLIRKISVETDILLGHPPASSDEDRRFVKCFITVEIKPYDVNMFNVNYS